jgi:hypothetical protein
VGKQIKRPRSYAEYLDLIAAHWYLLLLSVLTLSMSVWLALSRVSSLYESRALLMLEGPSRGATPSAQETIEGIKQRLSHTRMADRSEPVESPTQQSGSESGLTQPRSASLRIFQDDSSDSAGLFAIAYQDADPNVARLTAAALADEVVNSGSSASPSASPEVNSLRERAKQIAEQISSIESQQPWVVDASGPPSQSQSSRAQRPAVEVLSGQHATQEFRIEALKDKQFLLQQQLADIDKRIAAQRQVVEQQQRNPQMKDNATYAALVAKRTELQGQRDTLINRQELTDKHPRVAAIDDQINAINRQIEELRKQESGAARQSPEARELASQETERHRLSLELEVNNREISRANAGTLSAREHRPTVTLRTERTRSSPLRIQYQGLQKELGELNEKIENLAPQTTDAPRRLRLFEAATIPEAPVWPNRPLLISIAALIGLLCGIALSLLIESRQFGVVKDPKDIDFYGRMPLLGVVPRVPAPNERRQVKLNAIGRVAFGSIAAVLSAAAIYELLILTKLLERLG